MRKRLGFLGRRRGEEKIISKKYLPETNPHLLDEWDFEKNKIRPEEITSGSHKKVWWLCKDCGYSWGAGVASRIRQGNGCPACAGKVATETNNLAVAHPHLLEEWDYTKNKIRPEEITQGSGKKAWWKCSNKSCAYGWEAFIFNRTKKINSTGCPACAGQVVTNENNLKIKHPEIAKEWDFEKNGDLRPEEISYGSGKRVWWVCDKCGHEWKSIVAKRTCLGNGCPACAGKVITDRNNLKVLFPDLCKEWDYEKNKINPEDVTPGSRKKVWWFCGKCGYSWQAVVANRTYLGTGCFFCSRGNTSKISQKWLDILGVSKENREYYIKDLKIRVDGFDPKTNTAYEFLGDFWHGNLKVFSPGKINPLNKKSFGELHQETFRRFRLLEKAGYKIIYIWEKDFNGLRKGVEKK